MVRGKAHSAIGLRDERLGMTASTTPRNTRLIASRALASVTTLVVVGVLSTASAQEPYERGSLSAQPQQPQTPEAIPGTAPGNAEDAGTDPATSPQPPATTTASATSLLAYHGLPALVIEPGQRLPAAAREAKLSDIPADALAAYQRAATIVRAAQPTCELDWTLLAAIGLIASDHGRGQSAPASSASSDSISTRSSTGGSIGRAGGGSRNGPTSGGQAGNAAETHAQASDPANSGQNSAGNPEPRQGSGLLVGPRLLASDGTTLPDTDAGNLDGDRHGDRATGPMMIPPTTWAVVGVDADDDGQRNPQHIDDAALASAVLLCGAVPADQVTPGVPAATEVINALAERYHAQEEKHPSLPVSAVGPPPTTGRLPNSAAGPSPAPTPNPEPDPTRTAKAVRHGPQPVRYALRHLAPIPGAGWGPPGRPPGLPGDPHPWPNPPCPDDQPVDPTIEDPTDGDTTQDRGTSEELPPVGAPAPGEPADSQTDEPYEPTDSRFKVAACTPPPALDTDTSDGETHDKQ